MNTAFVRAGLFVIASFVLGSASAVDTAVIPFGSTWKYLDNGSNQGTSWRAPLFGDGSWATGPAELGYGEGDEATVVSYGSNASNKHITTYFRKSFTIADINAFNGFLLRLKKDDGAIVYANGVEVMRANMNQGTNSYTSTSYTGIGGSEELLLYELLLPQATFATGNNCIAVELHQESATSDDLSFDLQLTGLDATPSIFNPPMLAAATPTSVVVKWTTDVPTDSRVRYGTSLGSFTTNVTDPALVTEHEITVGGLTPSTTYYYAVGSSAGDLEGNDASHFFKTFPVQDSRPPLRIWAIGDAGTTYPSQLNVRDAYVNYAGASKADLWLMLGDNSYWQGRTFEYHESIFKVYQEQLRNTPLFPCIGNHDYYSGASGTSQTGPYYSSFVCPKSGQSGGVASNTEAYYSFDYGRVHFIALDSYGVSRAVGGAMYNWLQNDLNYADTHSDWVIAYWHHPPYTKGTHDSDQPAGDEMTDMRANFLPLLEAHGVDLVLCGHSHVYERSYLTDGNYGPSSTYSIATNRLDATSGRIDESGPYKKAGFMQGHKGTVYAVCGVSGKKGTAIGTHPVMFTGTDATYGSLVIDVVGSDLTLNFLNSLGAVIDHVTIRKTITLQLKTALQGCQDPNSGLMYDSLRTHGLVPLIQPYNGLFPFVGEGGNEVMAPGVLATSGPNAVVDWVFVELRDATDPTIVVRTRAALLQRDGDVVDMDNISPLQFHMPNANYYVTVRHRNHLGVMTAAPIALAQKPTVIDFRNATTPTYGTDARVNVNGVMTQWAGNCALDNKLLYTGTGNDRDPILVQIGGVVPTNTVNGYLRTDVNLDGVVKYTGSANDRDIILVNIGGSVPTNSVLEQLP